MSNVQPFRPRRQSGGSGPRPHPTDSGGGTIEELPDVGNPPARAKPDDAEILKAIGELNKKLQILAKNQKTLSNQLYNLRGWVFNTSHNVIMTAAYLDQVMYNVGWWVQTGDAKQSAETWPKTPHWR